MSSASARKKGTKGSSKERAPRASSKPKRARVDKLSISLGAEDVSWVTKRAKRLGTTASAVIADAVADRRRAEAIDELLRLLGHDDITEEEVVAMRRELFGP